MSRKCGTCGTPPKPYYTNDKNSLTQDHASIFRDTQYAAGVRVKEEFVIPALESDVAVTVPELVNLVVGSYLWNPAYGYLKIAHWDSCNLTLGLLNDDIAGAAIPGTVVSANNLWVVTSKPCCEEQDFFSLFPFLAEDYQIPGVGDQVTLTVTSTYGLIEGTIVRIGTHTYLLDTVSSALEIIVTNQGAGGAPGATVAAKDVNGDYQYLITQAAVSACTSGVVTTTVRLLGCDGVSENILEANYEGEVPIVVDASSSEVEFGFLDTEVRECTYLTSAVNVVSSTSAYTIDVNDSSIFSVGQIIQISNSSDFRWEITAIPDAVSLDIECTIGNPGSTFTIPINTSVCHIIATEAITEYLKLGWVPFGVDGDWDSPYIEIAGDYSKYFYTGQKLKFINDGTVKYAHVGDNYYYSAGITYVSLIDNLDFTLVSGAVTDIYLGIGNPEDFPHYFNFDSNPSGFSSLSTEEAKYWVEGDEIKGFIRLSGISNATSLACVVPIQQSIYNGYNRVVSQVYEVVDNGVALDKIGKGLLGFTQTLTVYPNQLSSSTWTNSGTKGCYITFCYPIAL